MASYCCNCRRCEGKRFVSYSTIRRHVTEFGKMECTQQKQCNGSTSGSLADLDLESAPSTSPQNFNDEDGRSDDSESDFFDSSYDNECESELMDDNGDAVSDVDKKFDSDTDDSSDESDTDKDVSMEDCDSPQFVLLQWILVVFLKIQHCFNITNRAADAILSLISYLLCMIMHPLSAVFPKTVSSAVSVTGINNSLSKYVYVVCPRERCNALYKKNQHSEKCTNVTYGRLCGAKLGYERHLSHGKVRWKPYKKFQVILPSSWLQHMFYSREFVQLIDLWRSRPEDNKLITDVYDGRMWKDLVAQGFFEGNYNLGLMINIDWFKPMKRSEYKVAGILLTVLNLPREDRFKKKWTIIAGIIPGPHEPEVNINTYLKPIVDDLIDLWNGMSLVQGSTGMIKIRARLLTVSTDLPALRKITQYLGHKADLGCHLCKFRAAREPGTSGASGKMSYYSPSASDPRQDEEVRKQADEYRQASTKSAANRIAQKNGVRASELSRLPYLDLVNTNCLDPMLLGMVKRETELNMAQLSPSQKNEFLRRVKSLKLPYDLGRLPTNIFDSDNGSGISSCTAQQWKNYAIVFARPCLYKLLPDRAYKCLVLLSRIITLISLPALTFEDLASLYRLLHEHHKLFHDVYGKWAISINYHMALHIPDVIIDHGPPQAFWCFGYERMNGFMARMPNSRRSIEVEVMNRYLCDFTTNCYSIEVPNIKVPRPLRGIICEDDDPLEPSIIQSLRVLSYLDAVPNKFSRQQVLDKGDIREGCSWPVKVLQPSKMNVKISQEFYTELRSFFQDLYGDEFDYAPPRIDKHGRCTVNGQTFSSNFNSTDHYSTVKCMFVDNTHELVPYFGIVRFFFTVTAVIQQQPKLHYLSYITWLKFHSSTPEPLSQLYTVNKNFYTADRIVSPRRLIRRCSLSSPKTSESFFFVSDLPK